MKIYSQVIIVFFPVLLFSQVGIGTTTPDASAALEIESTTSGILIPRLTQSQRNAIASPATGLMIYQTDATTGFYYYDGSAWQPFGGADNDWTVSGNDMYNANSGNVGVGTNAPTTKFHVENVGTTSVIVDEQYEGGLGAFTTGGNAGWVTQSTNVYQGTQAAGSGAIGDGETSYMEYAVTVPAGGADLSFFYSVSSESGYDFLRFYVNGTQDQEWSGAIGYTEHLVNLTAGAYTLRWEYSKDASCCTGGSDAAYVDNVNIVSRAPAAIRIVDGNEAIGRVLTSDASGNATWVGLSSSQISDIPDIVTISGMEIPACDSSVVGTTGSFNTTIRGTSTTVSWEVLLRQDTTGQVVNVGGTNVLAAPFNPERLQIRYDFSPSLPFNPEGMIFSANNNSTWPDTFSLNYANKSINSITMNITRTDRFGDTSANCWQGQFFFDIFMTAN